MAEGSGGAHHDRRVQGSLRGNLKRAQSHCQQIFRVQGQGGDLQQINLGSIGSLPANAVVELIPAVGIRKDLSPLSEDKRDQRVDQSQLSETEISKAQRQHPLLCTTWITQNHQMISSANKIQD
jgi:post-segregation antitoxin (ccd killing protein)